MILICSSIESGSRFCISDLYLHLPPEIAKDEHKSVAQYVVDQFGESEGFQFQFHDKRNLSKKARGYPSQFANATVFRFRCSQRLRTLTPSKLPYLKTRNRRAMKARFECKGSISVLFPSSFDMETNQQIAVVFGHSLHPGCEHYGVPLQVRRWIRDNPRSTSQAQRDEIFLAIEKGEIQGVKDKYLSAAHIHYWWRKEYAKTAYISNDPWVNVEYILKNHPSVFQFCSTFPILM